MAIFKIISKTKQAVHFYQQDLFISCNLHVLLSILFLFFQVHYLIVLIKKKCFFHLRNELLMTMKLGLWNFQYFKKEFDMKFIAFPMQKCDRCEQLTMKLQRTQLAHFHSTKICLCGFYHFQMISTRERRKSYSKLSTHQIHFATNIIFLNNTSQCAIPI